MCQVTIWREDNLWSDGVSYLTMLRNRWCMDICHVGLISLNVFRPPFYTHSWLNWIERMRLVLNKSQKKLDTSKRLHQNNTESAGKGTWSQLCHNRDCGLGKVQVHHAWRHLAGAPTTRSLILVPPRPKEECSKFLNLKTGGKDTATIRF